MVSISSDLPILFIYLFIIIIILEKLHVFSKKMVSISGDLPILRFLEKPHVFSKKNGLNIG